MDIDNKLVRQITPNLATIEGESESRFPACRSVAVGKRGNEKILVVDPGCSEVYLHSIVDKVAWVLDTHYHFDHIRGNHVLKNAKIYINEIEADVFQDRTNVCKRVGIYEVYGQQGIDDWLRYTSVPDSPQTPYSPSRRHEWFLSTVRINPGGTYPYGKDLNDLLFQGELPTGVKAIHAPGHTEGFCCMYFPEERVVYTGDIDLTKFGPYYGGQDSDIEDFIAYSKKIAKIDVDFFVTGHEAGILGPEAFKERLEIYLDIINAREEKILELLADKPRTLEDLRDLGLIYGGKKYLVDPWVLAWETISVRKHLERLESMGKIEKDQENKWRLV